MMQTLFIFFFSSRRRHTRLQGDWSSDVCSSDLGAHTAFEHGQAEFLDTEAARAEAVVAPARAVAIAAQLHGIRAELGTLGHGEAVFRTQAARARGTPLQRLRVLLAAAFMGDDQLRGDRKSTRLNSSHLVISYAVFCL